MALEASPPAARVDIAGALRQAAITGVIAFALLLPLIGFNTVQNIRNELVLETRWPLLAALVAIIAAALAAVAGTMYLMYYGVVSFADGFVPGVKAFTAAVLGGIGSLPGAVLGGLLIGLIETMWSAYFSTDYKDVAAFSILAITMIFLPQGILGRADVEKV